MITSETIHLSFSAQTNSASFWLKKFLTEYVCFYFLPKIQLFQLKISVVTVFSHVIFFLK